MSEMALRNLIHIKQGIKAGGLTKLRLTHEKRIGKVKKYMWEK